MVAAYALSPSRTPPGLRHDPRAKSPFDPDQWTVRWRRAGPSKPPRGDRNDVTGPTPKHTMAPPPREPQLRRPAQRAPSTRPDRRRRSFKRPPGLRYQQDAGPYPDQRARTRQPALRVRLHESAPPGTQRRHRSPNNTKPRPQPPDNPHANQPLTNTTELLGWVNRGVWRGSERWRPRPPARLGAASGDLRPRPVAAPRSATRSPTRRPSRRGSACRAGPPGAGLGARLGESGDEVIESVHQRSLLGEEGAPERTVVMPGVTPDGPVDVLVGLQRPARVCVRSGWDGHVESRRQGTTRRARTPARRSVRPAGGPNR